MKWQDNSYSQSDLSRMQKEAIERTKEMQMRAKKATDRFNQDFYPNSVKNNAQQNKDTSTGQNKNEKENSAVPSVQNGNDGTTLSKLLDTLNLDHEKIVLIGLMLVLLNDGGINDKKNQKLLMALAYLLFF